MGRATPTPSPSKLPSLRYFSRTAFRTGECRAAQSIFLCPSGASVGSFMLDPLLCMLLLLARPGLGALFDGHHLLGGFDLFAPAEEENTGDDQYEEGYQGDPDRNPAAEASRLDQEPRDQGADASDPHQHVAQDLEPGGGDLLGLHYLRPQEPEPLDPRVEGNQQYRSQHDP